MLLGEVVEDAKAHFFGLGDGELRDGRAVDAGREFPFSGLKIRPDDSAKSRFFQLRLEP